jgi:hypothetical protein
MQKNIVYLYMLLERFVVPTQIRNEITRFKSDADRNRGTMKRAIQSFLLNPYTKQKEGTSDYSIDLLVNAIIEIPDILVEFDTTMQDLSTTEKKRRSDFIILLQKELKKLYNNIKYNLI